MSDIMTPIPFGKMMDWILQEHKQGTVFGVHRPFVADPARTYDIFGHKLETPFGPAAGPHTQLAQNIVAAYIAGSRFFELKTVQKLDGKDITVEKPCIKADDECYNVEWSTELYVPQAFDEYVKAWFALKVLSVEFGLGASDGFQFNMSVGYDLAGIQLPKIDNFIEGLKDASQTPIFKECLAWLRDNQSRFSRVTAQDMEGISPYVCNSVTLSTMHGCLPQEIERITTYLIEEKGLNTFIKCNPTLLGYDYARQVLDRMGYKYVAFTDFHFKDDLQYADAVPMLQRLQARADKKGLTFGVKLTNTFPVDIKAGELPGQEMYMSGKSLLALSLSVAKKLADDFGGKLRIAYSGGADHFNIHKIVQAGIWPVTVATTLLKPGGYQRLEQFGQTFAGIAPAAFAGVDAAKVAALVEEAQQDVHYMKAKKALPRRKINKPVPLTDCFLAPCEEGCPIHQDITAYTQLVEEKKYAEALRVIISKNPLPFITGTICYHKCMNKCSRNFYEAPVDIRRNKLEAAMGGYADIMANPPKPATMMGKKAVIIGGGPAGLSAAYFLQLGGIQATVMEKAPLMGGAVRYIIPDNQIGGDTIDKDIRLIEATGVELVNNQEMTDLASLQAAYDYVILAIGAVGAGYMKQKGVAEKPVPGAFYKALGISVDEKGRPQVDSKTMKTNLDRVYAIGDGLCGLTSVVESIRDGSAAAAAILGQAVAADQFIKTSDQAVYARRGNLAEACPDQSDSQRCLHCDSICEHCVEVCPNRANISLTVPGMAKHQVIHVDYMCNECGNCRSFCPWDSAPYKDKFTLFATEADMENSQNQGFVVLDQASGRCKVRLQGQILDYTVGQTNPAVPEELGKIMLTVLHDYAYLLL